MADRVRVRSLTDAGRWYLVEGQPGATLGCSCPSFAFQREGAKRCKHTVLVATADRFVARCAAAHGRADGTLCRTCLVDVLGAVMRRRAKGRRR